MELRSYNVERIYSESVRCRINEELAVDKDKLSASSDDVKDMLLQIKNIDGYVPLCLCNTRIDGELWTPYLQIVEMIIRMGKKLGYVYYEGPLKPQTLVRILITK